MRDMAQRGSRRFNVTLDAERAAKLGQLAERTHINEGSLARSLLSQALDEAGADPRDVSALLDGIPGAFKRAQLGLRQAKAGRTVDLDEL
jgi:predicted transcriptional regulator